MPQEIEIHIDKIVLDGFDSMNPAELKRAIEDHLFSLISEQGLPNGLVEKSGYHKLNGGQINIDDNHKSRLVGSGIAKGILNGLSTPGSSNPVNSKR